MPVICQTFVENAWKKDLCSNCFKSSDEHRKEISTEDPPAHKSLTGQDSLTELQLGTNRYFTLSTTQFVPNSRYSAQISKWNDTTFHQSIDDQDSQASSVTSSKISDSPVTPPDTVADQPYSSTRDAGQLSNNLSITTSGATLSLIPNEENSASISPNFTFSLNSDNKKNNDCAGNSLSMTDKSTNKMKDSTTTSHNVIERLDSLVLGTPLNSLEVETQSQGTGLNAISGGKTGILKDSKRDRSGPEKKRGITFPDYEELQEIIGYGGDMYYSSDEDDAKEPDRKSDNEYSDEMTQEERNVLNITKKNTSFNSHPQNLKDPSGSPLPKLGVDKKHTPIISVRPFVREHTPGKVNMVSPMINGEIVTARNNKDNSSSKPMDNNKLFNSVRKLDHDDGSGRGEINTKTNKQDSLGSDGSTENSSSDSDSNTRDSPPPSDISFTSFDMKNKDISKPSPDSYKKQSSFLSSQIEEQKAKSTAATARLSFLSNYSLPKSDISTHKVKPSNYMDEHVTILSAAKAKLSLPNKNSSLCDEDEAESDQTPIDEQKAKSTAAAARLSFLNSTINGNSKPELPFPPIKLETERDPSPVPVSSQISEDKSEPAQDDENPADKSQVPKNGPEKVTSNRSDSCRDSPKVKLTRKSPYVVGPYASTSILKGTPKPMITRKPPILKDKPKVPLKPNKLMMRSPSSSPSPSPSPHDAKRSSQLEGEKEDATDSSRPKRNTSPEKKSPVAAPRKASFRQKSEYVNLNLAQGNDIKLEDDPSITVKGLSREGSECKDIASETSAPGHDRNSSLIISVSSVKTKLNEPPSCSESHKIETTDSSGNHSLKSENSPPQVQKNLANKNKEALEAIRKSLSNKLISSAPPPLVVESIKASESSKGSVLVNKTPVEKTASNSFEENRASIADALQFNRHDNVARPSTKRQAPRPPDSSTDELEETETPLLEFYESPTETNDDPSNEKTEEIYAEPEVCPEPKLAPAIRNSSMKSEHCNKNKDSKPRTVQFSPETVTVTVPSANAVPKIISYNRWMGKSQNPYLESSFTGQPITMYPPGAISPPMKKPGVAYTPTPIVDDGPRKWTEKKNKWRSKSTPRSTEIDEIIGSSKTKAPNRLGIFAPSSPQPIKRQSRVEIYESEKKLQKKGKFSLKKLFKLQGVPDAMEDNADNKFIDKEHEREILERQKVKVRPEIIHPLDLLNGGVEVVKITPKNSLKGHYEKHKNSKSAEKSAVKRHADLKAKLDSDSKDSGHDTSSIHTETSEGTTSSGGDYSHTSVDFSHSSTPVGVVPQPTPEALLSSASREISASQGCLGVNSVGKPKPLPPPRSQSLETFEKKEDSEVDFSPDVVSTPQSREGPTIISHQRTSSTPEQTVYANLGHLRSNLTPNKPQRTASMREANQSTESENVTMPSPPTEPQPSPAPLAYITPGKINLGDVTIPTPNSSHLAHFHAKTSSITGSLNSEALSDSTISFPSSTARKAMDGSEADSERDSVSPQRLHDEGLYGEEGSPVTSNRKRVSRLSMRKGRSIVHKNLEDNYGAVITANHEAIAQILEQVCQNRPTPSSLKSLASAMNLRFADFSVLSESEGLRTEKRAFFPATWGSSHLPVTLMVSKDMALNNNNVKNSFALTPIAQFVDQVPSYLVSQQNQSPGGGHINNQAVVWALSRLQVLQFGTFAKNMKLRRKSLRVDEFEKDMSFVLLQLINGLKFLQAQGIEETIADLDNFLLARSDNDTNHRLIITEECHKAGSSSTQAKMSLCQCALSAMLQLFDIPDPVGKACEPQQKIELPQIIPSVSMFKTMAVILQKDGGVSLGQVKSMLEFMLWGPSDIIFDFKMGREAESREEALQRWLDLERATVLNNLIRTQGLWNIHLTVYEEYHLLFLVRTCAKMLREASLLFESEVSRM